MSMPLAHFVTAYPSPSPYPQVHSLVGLCLYCYACILSIQIELGRTRQTPAQMLLHWALWLFLRVLHYCQILKIHPVSPTNFNSQDTEHSFWSLRESALGRHSHRLCPSSPVALSLERPQCSLHPFSPSLQVLEHSPSWNLPKPLHCCSQGRTQRHFLPVLSSRAHIMHNNTWYWRSTFLKGAQSAFQTLPHNIPMILTREVAPTSTALFNQHKKSRNQQVIHILLRIKVGLLKYHWGAFFFFFFRVLR